MTDRPPVNPTGVYVLVWVGDTSRESIALAARRTAQTGFDLLELSPYRADASQIE